jgi:hypothetical protein
VIDAPTLETIRDARLALDHAIRCPAPLAIARQERLRAPQYRSRLVEEWGAHLCELLAGWDFPSTSVTRFGAPASEVGDTVNHDAAAVYRVAGGIAGPTARRA